MTILFEEYPYETAHLATLLPERYYWPVSPTHSNVPFVGYCHADRQAVVILPKVFLQNGRFLGEYLPDDLRQLPNRPDIRQRLKTEHRLNFLFTISTWLYLAIRQYQHRHPDNKTTEPVGLPAVINTADSHAATELDWVLSLLRFHRDNASLLTFLKKHSPTQRGQISWNRTVSRQLPIIDTTGRPVYAQTAGKQRVVNVDEELIVLFLLVLTDLKTRYYLRIDLPELYVLPTGADREALFRNALRRLRQMRYKYFSDQLLRLWDLLWGYFTNQERVKSVDHQPEITLARDFNRVFEDIIDHLLSDASALNRFKNQKDGRELDHIFDYQDLVSADHIYYIGDSKYYKDTTRLGRESIYKQYTYARNVIQFNIDLLNTNKLKTPLTYRDELTEGYNPTPNFFISAVVDNELTWSNPGLTFSESVEPPNHHFANRLFDRDTLLLQAYNINFLFVLSAYVSGSKTNHSNFQQQARMLFREKLVRYLSNTYEFWRVTPLTKSLDDFVTHHFRALAGRMYRPSDFADAIMVAYLKKAPMDLETLFGDTAKLESWPLK